MKSLCKAAEVSRAGYYRFTNRSDQREKDLELRDSIQRVAIEMPMYGYRRITAELRRSGLVVNHKRVLRITREDNLLCHRRRSFVRTTDSNYRLKVYPNLAKGPHAERSETAMGR
ncbi:MAG: IS3 family transposase [Blastocatellia bacterium]